MRYSYLLPLVLAITGVKPVAVPTHAFDPFQQLAPPTEGLPTKVSLRSPSQPSCNDMHTKNWASGDVMGGAINAFCKEAHDKYKPSERFFLSDEDFLYQSTHFNMTVNIPTDYTFTEDDCIKQMSLIQTQCNNDHNGNPMNWKYGGNLAVGSANFDIGVRDARYVSGRCHSRSRLFNSDLEINCELFDASGTSIYNYPYRTKVGGYNASMPAPGEPTAYYDYLVLTLDKVGALDYTLGSQTWTSLTQSSDPVAPWCEQYDLSDGVYMDVYCWFSC